MCPPCVILVDTYCCDVCASCHSVTVCTERRLLRCVTALWVDTFLCEAVAWTFNVWQTLRRPPLVFYFCVGCRRRSPVPDKLDSFFVFVLFFSFVLFFVLAQGKKLLWSGSAFRLWGPHGVTMSLCVSSLFSLNVAFYPLCPLCGPRVLWSPTEHCHVESKDFSKLWTCQLWQI